MIGCQEIVFAQPARLSEPSHIVAQFSELGAPREDSFRNGFPRDCLRNANGSESRSTMANRRSQDGETWRRQPSLRWNSVAAVKSDVL